MNLTGAEKDSIYMTINDEAYLWAKNNASSIKGKRVEYLKKWAKMHDEIKRWRTLLPEDGLNEHL